MLSKRAIELAEQIMALNKELDELISKETDERWGMCVDSKLLLNPSLFADPRPTLQELEDLVGPVEYSFVSASTGSTFYTGKIGSVDVIAAVPNDKPKGAEE